MPRPLKEQVVVLTGASSGIGREGGTEGLLPFLETKTVILEGAPKGYDT